MVGKGRPFMVAVFLAGGRAGAREAFDFGLSQTDTFVSGLKKYFLRYCSLKCSCQGCGKGSLPLGASKTSLMLEDDFRATGETYVNTRYSYSDASDTATGNEPSKTDLIRSRGNHNKVKVEQLLTDLQVLHQWVGLW